MSDTEKKVSYGVSADASGFEKAMRQAASAAQGSAGAIDKQFKKIQETFAGVQKAFLGIAAVIAGGGALKAILSATADWNGEAGKMGKQLGVTTEKASVLMVALNHLGIDTDTYTNASLKMSKQIFSNAGAFATLGVAVRDTTTGAYRPVTEVMGEVNQKLAAIKNPIEQNIAGMQVYGKSWGEMRAIVKLTHEQLSVAEERARTLGLIVGPDGAAAAKQYKEQMRDVELVGKAMEIQFGNALLPVFTKTGKFMAEEGPMAAKTFGLVLEGVAFAAQYLWLSIKDLGDGLGALMATVHDLFTNGGKGIAAIGKVRNEEAAKNYAAFQRMKAQFGEPMPVPTVKAAEEQGSQYQFKPEKGDKPDPSRAAAWETALAEKKAAIARQSMEEGQLREYSKAEELKYWGDIKAMPGLNATERIQVARKVADVESAMVKDSFDQKVRGVEAEAALYKNDTDKRLDLERQIQAMYATGTKGYEDAQKRINEITRQALDQDKQVQIQKDEMQRAAQLAGIQRLEQLAQLEFDLGNISKEQLLQQQQNFEEQRYAIAKTALAKRLDLANQVGEKDPDVNKGEVARVNAEIEALASQHEQRMATIRTQGAVLAVQSSKEIYAAMTNDMQGGLAKMMQGMTTFSGFFRSLWNTLLSTVTNVLAKMLMEQIENTTAMAAVKKAFAIFDIQTNAAQTGAASAASAAETPMVGWMIAAGAAAAGFAMAGAFSSSVPSFHAAGGFDIPGTLNPITQLHAREMVLPAKHADVIRGMADQGAPSGGGDSVVNLHVHATDAQSVARLFRDNGEHIVRALRAQHRNLAF